MAKSEKEELKMAVQELKIKEHRYDLGQQAIPTSMEISAEHTPAVTATEGDKHDKVEELFQHMQELEDEVKVKDQAIQEFTAMFERLNADSDQWQKRIAE